MKLLVENDVVVCSLENKNSEFLSACAGLFDGFYNDKLKMYWDDAKRWNIPDEAAAAKWNTQRLSEIIRNAKRYKVEIDDRVEQFLCQLQTLSKELEVRNRALQEEQELRDKWARLCANGCGKCQNLVYDIDLPICKPTGEILEEKNVQKYIGGVLHLFNLEPFPSENCPFNINKKQGANNERLSETCNCKI